MKSKRGIICSFILFFMAAGCGTNQQLADKTAATTINAPDGSAPAAAGVNPDSPSGPSFDAKDADGYQLRPMDIEIKEGRPYLPVGAEFTTKEGKVDLGDVIKAMADHKGFSVSWADDVDQQRPVDCYIKAADNFYDALDNILRQLDYFYEIAEDTIVVKYKVAKKYKMAMPNLNEDLDTSLGGNMLPSTKEGSAKGMAANAKLKISSEEFNFWDDLSNSLSNIVNCDGCPAPIIDRTLGTITVTASKRVHEAVERHLHLVEQEAYKQVVIEAKIIEVALDENHATGIDWENVFSGTDLSGKSIGGFVGLGDPTSGLLWSKDTGWNRFLDWISISDTTWEVVVSAFSEYGDTRIMANPKVHILNGHGAVLSAGQVLSYLESCDITTSSETGQVDQDAEVNSVTEGLSVGIKANITGDDEVILYVFPAITRLIRFRDIFNSDCGTIQAPEMSVREMATYAKVRDGEILVIGGLIQETEDTNTKKVPILGDLPYLGKFFSYERIDNSNSELVILLKPRIVVPQ